MKKVVSLALSLALATSVVVADEKLSMSEADRAMYQEMLENNPADIFVEEGAELLDELGGEEALAKFLGQSEESLPKYCLLYTSPSPRD